MRLQSKRSKKEEGTDIFFLPFWIFVQICWTVNPPPLSVSSLHGWVQVELFNCALDSLFFCGETKRGDCHFLIVPPPPRH